MFELEAQISQWRENLGQGQSCQEQDLCELEDHLRETIIQLTAKGLSTEEAFLVACRRLGDTRILAQEYAKINPAAMLRNRLTWMCGGLIGCYFAIQTATVLSNGLTLLAGLLGMGGRQLALFSMCSQFLSVFACLWIFIALVERLALKPVKRTWLKPGPMAVLTVLGILPIMMLATLLRVAMVQILPPQEIGFIAMYKSSVHFFGPFLPLLLIIALGLRLRRDAFGSTDPAAGPTLPDSH